MPLIDDDQALNQVPFQKKPSVSTAVVFVEVKTRIDEGFAQPEDVISFTKKGRLNKAAHYFLATNNIEGRAFRFDAVAVVLSQTGQVQIRHYENIFVS